MTLIDRLVSVTKKSILMLVLFAFGVSSAEAEYYVVYGAPQITVICASCDQKPKVIKHHKKVYKKPYKKVHKKHVTHYKKNSYHISVSCVNPLFPCDSCYGVWAPDCATCGSSYVTQPMSNGMIMIDEDTSGVYWDRRTADDVGAELNIDY